jgi:quercetin dioxygenase-like cupin family protein
MPVIAAADAPVFDAGGATIVGLASPSRGSVETSAWRVRLEPAQPSPPHALSREEILVVLEGSLTARYGDREETADAGGALIIPPGQQVTLLAAGDAAEAVCILPTGGQAITDAGVFTPPWAQ